MDRGGGSKVIFFILFLAILGGAVFWYFGGGGQENFELSKYFDFGASEFFNKPPEGILVSIISRGGDCTKKTCPEAQIFDNGEYRDALADNTILSEKYIANIKYLIETADYERIKSRLFERPCPADFGEKEYVFYLYRKNEPAILLRSCRERLEADEPLFGYISEVISAVRGEPFNIYP